MKQWYEELFDNYGLKYDNEVYVQGTIGECDFFEKEVKNNKSIRILDIGCGTGRHSIELAKRGYSVTGIDQSESLLKRAKEKAAEQKVQVNFQRHDARKLTFQNEFDLVIMICEGGFSLMETDEMNFQILKSAANALCPKGKFIFTTLNGLFPLYHSVKDFLDSNTKEAKIGELSYDLMTFREYSTISVEDDSGNTKELKCNERYYVPCEITWLLKSLNFKTIDIYGATLGAFSRNDKLTTEDFEMLVVAEI